MLIFPRTKRHIKNCYDRFLFRVLASHVREQFLALPHAPRGRRQVVGATRRDTASYGLGPLGQAITGGLGFIDRFEGTCLAVDTCGTAKKPNSNLPTFRKKSHLACLASAFK
jgi:hypothetical protein